jgi:hypothetical protein
MVFALAPQSITLRRRCVAPKRGSGIARRRSGHRQVPEGCRIWRSTEVARLCKRADENRAARDLEIGSDDAGPRIHRDRSRTFGASSCAGNRLLSDGPMVANLADRLRATLEAAHRPHMRTKGGERFGSNGKWNARFRCRASAGRRLASSSSNSEEPRKLLAPRLLYYIAEAEGLSSS